MSISYYIKSKGLYQIDDVQYFESEKIMNYYINRMYCIDDVQYFELESESDTGIVRQVGEFVWHDGLSLKQNINEAVKSLHSDENIQKKMAEMISKLFLLETDPVIHSLPIALRPLVKDGLKNIRFLVMEYPTFSG